MENFDCRECQYQTKRDAEVDRILDWYNNDIWTKTIEITRLKNRVSELEKLSCEVNNQKSATQCDRTRV